MTDQPTNQQTNTQPQAPDYGEPWKVGVYHCDIATRDFNPVAEVGWKKNKNRDRIISCVNACAGLSNDELKNPLISVGVLRNALQALGREQKARDKPWFEEELEYEIPAEPGFCSISIDAKNLSKHKNIDILYHIVNKMAEAFEHGEDFSNLGNVAYNAIYQIKLNDKENK